jgi:hypothetical protein
MAPMMAEAMATVEADSDWEEEAMATAAKAKEGVVTEEEQAEAGAAPCVRRRSHVHA